MTPFLQQYDKIKQGWDWHRCITFSTVPKIISKFALNYRITRFGAHNNQTNETSRDFLFKSKSKWQPILFNQNSNHNKELFVGFYSTPVIIRKFTISSIYPRYFSYVEISKNFDCIDCLIAYHTQTFQVKFRRRSKLFAPNHN